MAPRHRIAHIKKTSTADSQIQHIDSSTSINRYPVEPIPKQIICDYVQPHYKPFESRYPTKYEEKIIGEAKEKLSTIKRKAKKYIYKRK